MRNRTNMSPADFRNARWCAVYGAMIAAQVQEYRNRTSNCVDDKMMEGFHEEAETIADMAEEASDAA